MYVFIGMVLVFCAFTSEFVVDLYKWIEWKSYESLDKRGILDAQYQTDISLFVLC